VYRPVNDHRRALCVLLGAMATVTGMRAVGQTPSRQYRVAWMDLRTLGPGVEIPNRHWFEPFRRRLSDRGFVEGRNLDLRVFALNTEQQDEAKAQRIREAVAWKPDVILTRNATNTKLAQQATAIIPIVFYGVDDPVVDGIVASMTRPGRNATGVAGLHDVLAVKRLELIPQLLTGSRRVTVVIDSSTENMAKLSATMRDAARRMDIKLIEIDAKGQGLPPALERVAASKPDIVLIAGVINDNQYYTRLPAFQARYRIPIMDDEPSSVDRGLILALGEEPEEIAQRIAEITVKVLYGAKPPEIPVDAAQRIRLVINAGVAKKLGIKFSPAIWARADRIVD